MDISNLSRLLDDDAYTFIVGQAVFMTRRTTKVKYKLVVRKGLKQLLERKAAAPGLDSRGQAYTTWKDVLHELCEHLRAFVVSRQKLIFDNESLTALDRNIAGWKLYPQYQQFLANLKLPPVDVSPNFTDGSLDLTIDGDWASAIFWEVPLLAAFNSFFNVPRTKAGLEFVEAYANLKNACPAGKDVPIFEFGTRRRTTFQDHQTAVNALANFPQFRTSNVLLAASINRPAVGTISHQWTMGHGDLPPKQALIEAHKNWMAAYPYAGAVEELPYPVLSDTYSTDFYWSVMKDVLPSNAYYSCRQDSGDPIKWFLKTKIMQIKHRFSKMRYLFSDNLNPETVKTISEFVSPTCVPYGFASGTYLLNGTATGAVIKLVEVNGTPVVKVSDDPVKAIGEPDAIRKFFYEAYRMPLDLVPNYLELIKLYPDLYPPQKFS